MTTTPIIQAPDWTTPFELMCDASNYALGVVLAQANYTTTEKELLAIVFALEKFRSYLLGTRVIVYIDHAALKYLLMKAESNLDLSGGCFGSKSLIWRSMIGAVHRTSWLTT